MNEMYIYIHVHIYIYIYIYIYVHLYLYTYIYLYICYHLLVFFRSASPCISDGMQKTKGAPSCRTVTVFVVMTGFPLFGPPGKTAPFSDPLLVKCEHLFTYIYIYIHICIYTIDVGPADGWCPLFRLHFICDQVHSKPSPTVPSKAVCGPEQKRIEDIVRNH